MAKYKRNRNKAKRNFTVKTPTANRNYKDTVFRMLFSDRKNLLSLYNAVNQSNYNNPDDLEIVTLENAIYMGMKNDLAFIMDMKLNGFGCKTSCFISYLYVTIIQSIFYKIS